MSPMPGLAGWRAFRHINRRHLPNRRINGLPVMIIYILRGAWVGCCRRRIAGVIMNYNEDRVAQ